MRVQPHLPGGLCGVGRGVLSHPLDFDRCRSATTHFVVCLPSPITVHERTLKTVSICIVTMGTSPAASELLLTSEQRYALQSHLPSKVVHIR